MKEIKAEFTKTKLRPKLSKQDSRRFGGGLQKKLSINFIEEVALDDF